MKRTIGQVLLGVSLAAVLLAIWSPVGDWWQWAATAVVLLFLGAMLLGTADGYAEGGEVGPPQDDTPIEFRGLYRSEDSSRPTYGKRKEEDR